MNTGPRGDPRRARLEELFLAASDLPAEERAAFLDAACDADADLRREVDAMLAADARADAVLGGAIGDLARSAVERQEAVVGTRIGPYRIEGELGRGGMGRVFLGVRDDAAFEKRVAIKLIRWGDDDPEVRHRFLHERRILAQLDHPYIARLLDGGTTAEQVPYVVMEHVEGEPLDVYCDRRRLSTTARLELFARVCDAVQYAHANLIVHRDLKPGNILVTAEGAPKLLDFGIAKLLDAPAGAPVTRTQMRLMTPEYASPEQVRGEPVTIASDVYSLGVVLYELLSGRRPYALADSSPAEVERVITTADPLAPSAAVSRDPHLTDGPPEPSGATTPDEVAQARGVGPDRLRRQLAGDLDTIVLTAMHKDRARRYGSVQELADDLRRHREGLPVLARRDSVRYRVGKFVRRHRAGVVAAVTAGVAVSGLTVFYLFRLANERDRAQLEAEKANQVVEFLTGLFEVSDPGVSRGEDLTARTLLERGAARVNRELAGEPAVQATMLATIGNVYEKLGLPADAEPLLAEALEVTRRLHGPRSPETAEALAALGALALSRDQLPRAESLLTQAYDLRRALLPANDPAVVRSIAQLAGLANRQGRPAAADSLYSRAEALAQRLPDADRDLRATILSNHSEVLKNLDRLDDAEASLRQALAIRESLYGPEHPDVGATLNLLGLLLRFRGRYDEAEAVYRDLVRWGPRVLGENHPDVGTWFNNLAVVLKDKGEYAEAERIQRRVLAIWRAAYGEPHSQVALALNNLANLRQDQGDLAGAEELMLQALAMNRQLFGEDHPNVATNLNNLASVAAERGAYDRATAYQERVLELDRKELGPDHEYVAMDLSSLGTYRLRAGHAAAAERPAREGYALALKVRGPDHPTTASAAYSLAEVLVATGRAAEAEPLARQALRIRTASLPAGHWNIALTQTLLGEVLTKLHRYDEAERVLTTGYEGLRASRPEGNFYRRLGRDRLVALYRAWGRPDQAAAVPR